MTDETTPESGAGDVIAAFYDRHPYPPAPKSLDGYRTSWEDEGRQRSEYHLLFPQSPFRHDLDILVAGCGTSQAARHALRWPGGNVVGIDVSRASLDHTADLKERYDLDNLEIHELTIEQAGDLDRRFDLIVCTGVLHHLEDPGVGLRALHQVIRPGGALQLMVYAPFGRHGVTMIQEYGRLLGIGSSEKEIRDLAHTLAEVPVDHPIAPLLRNSADFRDNDAIADALLNPRETTYSVPELLSLLDNSGLSFGRWYRQAPYLPQCGAPAATPHTRLLRGLPAHKQFAAMELFRGSMVRHTLVAHRDEDGADGDRSGLTDNRWEQLTPIRLPETVIVEERLPRGAAAVLINQSHTYPDLVLPIRAPEHDLFATIDGRHTIADLISRVIGGAGDREGWHRFFQRLWWFDQIVFDVSKRGEVP